MDFSLHRSAPKPCIIQGSAIVCQYMCLKIILKIFVGKQILSFLGPDVFSGWHGVWLNSLCRSKSYFVRSMFIIFIVYIKTNESCGWFLIQWIMQTSIFLNLVLDVRLYRELVQGLYKHTHTETQALFSASVFFLWDQNPQLK